ncbi:MAG: hypothetical protein ACN4GZ_20650 [Acidimicrobiales bacterium]
MRARAVVALFAVGMLAAACTDGSATQGSAGTVLSIQAPSTTSVANVEPEPEPDSASTSCTPLEPTVSIVDASPVWEDGMVRELGVVRQRMDSRVNSPVSTSSAVDLRVIASDDGWAFAWPYSAAQFLGGPSNSATEGDVIDLRYGVDARGSWRGLENPEEVRAFVLDLVDSFAASGLDQRSTDGLRQLYSGLSDEQLGVLFSEDPQVFHYFDGVEIGIEEELTFDVELDNIFGGSSFPATSTIRIADSQDAEGCVVFEDLTVLDAQAALPILVDSLSEVYGVEVPAEEQVIGEGFWIEKKVTGRWDQGSKLFVEVKLRKVLRIQGDQVTDIVLISDVGKRR